MSSPDAAASTLPLAPDSARHAPDASLRAISLYRAVWRWHFYAGLLVLPFMILLAVTGGLYLFRDELDGLIHRDLKQVVAQPGPVLPASRLIDAALAARPGTPLKIITPVTATASAEIVVKTEDGRRSVYVDPYDGRVLGELPDRGTVMWLVRRLHSLAEFGPIANGIIEIVGGWSILLVGTGFYLWWPRRQTGGVVSVRGTPAKRVFWRDLHAVTGAFAGLAIGFMSLSGMPWSVFWGEHVNEWANGTNFGYPSGVYVDVPMSNDRLSATNGPTAWSLEQAQMPQSTPPAAPAPIGVDAARAAVDALGLSPGYTLSLPAGPTGVYTATVYPDDVSLQRVVHLDQYTGKPLINMSYADYGPAAKAMEWGISVHMGQEYGLANQLFMLALCLATILMSVSAGVMWWKRRPAGAIGVPPLPADRTAMRGLLAIMVVVGLVFPLVGASLLVMLALDLLVAWRQRAARA